MDNDFLKNIDSSQIRELVEAMYKRDVAKDEYVILEDDVGSHLFVSAEGEFEVVKDGKVLGIMGAGKAFGELAILYNCKRTASIKGRRDRRMRNEETFIDTDLICHFRAFRSSQRCAIRAYGFWIDKYSSR